MFKLIKIVVKIQYACTIKLTFYEIKPWNYRIYGSHAFPPKTHLLVDRYQFRL